MKTFTDSFDPVKFLEDAERYCDTRALAASKARDSESEDVYSYAGSLIHYAAYQMRHEKEDKQ